MNELEQVNELEVQVRVSLSPIKQILVVDQESSSHAAAARRELKRYRTLLSDRYKELTNPWKRNIETVKERIDQIDKIIVDVDDHLKAQQYGLEKKLEEVRIEKERIEREENRKRQEEARLLIEKQRQEAEAAAKALREEAETLAMFADPAEVEEVQKEIERKAQVVLATAEAEATRISFETKKEHWDARKEISTVKVEGARRVWKWKVIDESLIPMEYKSIILNESKIKIALKDKTPIAGIEYYQDLQMTVR